MSRAQVSPVLEVASVEKSLEFYLALGFRAVPLPPWAGSGAAAEIHGARLVLVRRPAGAPPPAGAVLHFAVPDVHAVRTAALRLGALAPDAGTTDLEAFRVTDPDGHVLAFSKERRRARPRPRRAVRKKRKRRK